MNFPEKSVIHTKTLYDGDKVIESVTYPNNKNKTEKGNLEPIWTEIESLKSVEILTAHYYKYPMHASNSMW